MPKFWIRYALSGGFGGCENADWNEVECKDLKSAEEEAYQGACEEYDQYEGLHGLRTTEEIMEEEDVNEKEAEELYQEERESWLDYEVSETKPKDQD